MAALLFFLLVQTPNIFLSEDELIISDKLFNQATCWNAGDIDCFMEDYWHSDSLMYIGKNGVTYGWQNTSDNYKKRYPSKREMGILEFEIIKMDRLDEFHYFMVGKWSLKRAIGDISGHFSLIWKKINQEWVIIADHSS